MREENVDVLIKKIRVLIKEMCKHINHTRLKDFNKQKTNFWHLRFLVSFSIHNKPCSNIAHFCDLFFAFEMKRLSFLQFFYFYILHIYCYLISQALFDDLEFLLMFWWCFFPPIYKTITTKVFFLYSVSSLRFVIFLL